MSGPLLEHYPGCYGCGTGNSRGLGLRMTWHQDTGTAECVVLPPTRSV